LNRPPTSATTPVKLSIDSRLSVDKSSVEGGEILRIARGAVMEYLQPQGLAESHFVRRANRRQDIQIVAGTPDSLQGQRPVGVEAASAIRQLTEQGSNRARAKGAGMLEWAALLLQKMVRADIEKSTELIYYRDLSGAAAWLNPDDFRAEDFEVRWAQQSGSAQGEQDRRDLDFQLLQLGVIDAKQLLDDLDYPDRDLILQRVAIQQLQAAQAAAAQPGGSKQLGPGGGE